MRSTLDAGERTWRTRFPRFFDLTATAPPVVTEDAVYATDAQGETYRIDRRDRANACGSSR